MYQKILLPTDGSDNARQAGKHAIWIADKTNAEIVVLNVIDVNYLQPSYLPSFRKNLDNCLRDEGKKALQEFKNDLEEAQCQGICKNIKFTTMIKEGKPHLEILKTIDEEDIDLEGGGLVIDYRQGSVVKRAVFEFSECGMWQRPITPSKPV